MPKHDFIHFRDLDPKRSNTWVGKSILSVDVDWAHDSVLSDTIDIVVHANIKACFFITHPTKLLTRLRDNPLIELGLHPNFDPLLNGDNKQSPQDILAEISSIVPEAKVLRSHSMTTSGRWLRFYKELGITHLSNYIMYGDPQIHPFFQINDLVEAPVFFADDGLLIRRDMLMLDISTTPYFSKAWNGLQVYNFHPIHIFLNSETLDRYERSRPFHNKPDELMNYRYEGFGSRDRLIELLD